MTKRHGLTDELVPSLPSLLLVFQWLHNPLKRSWQEGPVHYMEATPRNIT